MPNLPPLPLTDGALLVDNSFIEGFTSCPRMTEYQNLRKRASAFQRSALSFGTAVHEVLAYLSRTYNDHYKLGDPVVDKIITDYFEMNPMPEGEFRSEKLCRELVREYTSNYEIEPWSVVQSTKGPLVEMPFITKLYDAEAKFRFEGQQTIGQIPIYWTGKIDLVVDYKQRIWVVDRKTTSMLGSNFTYEQQMSAQHPGYCWSLWQTTGKIPAGFIVDALRVSEMSDKMRASTPAAQKKWWGEGFQRPEHYVTEASLTEWRDNVIVLIDEFLWHYSRDYMPRKQRWCVGKYGRCQFYDVCSLPDPAQRPMILDSNLFVDHFWSPLNKTNKANQT